MPDQSDDFSSLDVLPAGTRFGELEILRTVGVGGFGIVYLAQDHALQREVAIKEYMPGQLAQREGGSQVSVRAGSLQETFDIGRRSFVNEARLLARFDHRALLKVYQFWEANGTAYMAMPYLQGLTLRQTRQAMTGPPDEAWMLALLLPLLDGLTLLHAEGVLHRDIAPDNILLPAVGKDGGSDPILLDFGAARRAIGDRTQTLTAILKPSYAPIEQYAEATSLRQGPWTDVYALGAVMHYLVTGHPPPPSTARAVADDYVPLAGQTLGNLSRPLLAAIDWALAVRPQGRPQSAAQLRDALLGRAAPPADEATLIDLGRRRSGLDLELGDAGVSPPAAPEMRAERAAAAAPAQATSKGAGRWIGLILLLLAAAALGGWWLQKPDTRQDAPAMPLPAAASAAAPVGLAASAAGAVPVSAASVPSVILGGPPPTVARPAQPKPQATAPVALPKALPPPMPRQDSSMIQPTLPAEPQPGAASVSRPPAASAPLPALAVPAAQAPSFAGPREACGSRVFIAMQMCIDRECKNPAYASNPECVRLREIEEQRGRRVGR